MARRGGVVGQQSTQVGNGLSVSRLSGFALAEAMADLADANADQTRLQPHARVTALRQGEPLVELERLLEDLALVVVHLLLVVELRRHLGVHLVDDGACESQVSLGAVALAGDQHVADGQGRHGHDQGRGQAGHQQAVAAAPAPQPAAAARARPKPARRPASAPRRRPAHAACGSAPPGLSPSP